MLARSWVGGASGVKKNAKTFKNIRFSTRALTFVLHILSAKQPHPRESRLPEISHHKQRRAWSRSETSCIDFLNCTSLFVSHLQFATSQLDPAAHTACYVQRRSSANILLVVLNFQVLNQSFERLANERKRRSHDHCHQKM